MALALKHLIKIKQKCTFTFHIPKEPSGETNCSVLKPCYYIIYHHHYHLLY